MTSTLAQTTKIQIRAGLSGYVADITAAIFGAILGLPEAILDNHASYIDHWVRILKSDKNAILTAASRADVAVDYLLGFAQPGRSRIVEREPALMAA